jgi:prepilin-type N-terminal cleavage/methylation domain-containing protein
MPILKEEMNVVAQVPWSTRGRRSYLGGRQGQCLVPGHRAGGFTLIEILVTLAMLLLLLIGALGTITLLDRSSRRQGQHTTALEVAQGKLDEFLSQVYNPPVPPYSSTNYYQSNWVTLAANKSGTATSTFASVISLVQPVLNGHVVTVTVSFTNYDQLVNVQLQTLINRHSGGQP